MKYPFRHCTFSVCEFNKWNHKYYTVKTVSKRVNKKGKELTVSEFPFPLFKTEEEAREYLKKLSGLTYLGGNRSVINDMKFRGYYGCEYCCDARTKAFKIPEGEGKAKPVFCTHKECPYAEDIEKAGGFGHLLKACKDEEFYNFNFGNSFVNYWEGR